MKKFSNKILPLFLIAALFFSTSGYYNVEHICACYEEEVCNDAQSDCCSIYDKVLAEESGCVPEHQEHSNCGATCVTTCSYDVNRIVIYPDQLPVNENLKLKPEFIKSVIIDFEEENKNFYSTYFNLELPYTSPNSHGKELVISLYHLKTPCLVNS